MPRLPHLLSVVAMLGACQSPATDPPLPWLRGLDAAIASERATGATDRLLAEASEHVVDNCALGAYTAVELVADVAARPGRERVVASYAAGIYVLDRENHVVAQTPGYPCEGSADSLEILAAGTSWGMQQLVVVGTTGGHHANATWLGLFRVASHGRLEAMFTGDVETHLGDRVQRGAILLLPGSLIYRPPGGQPALWVFDPVAGVYLPPFGELEHDEHDGPSTPISML